MTPLFKKLNLGNHETLLVLNAPASFESELDPLAALTIHRKPPAKSTVGFGLAFAVTQAELDRFSAQLAKATEGDAVVWVAYPKKSSKRYRCEFDRDSGWNVLGEAGFEPVRQVAIDEDWSALRFRRVAYIKTMKRNAEMTISAEGKQRTQG